MSKQFEALLDFWAKNNMNVLLEGEHGFGKTAVVGDTFERNGFRWKYFSASTMDPWVDLVGVPKEYTDEAGQTYLRLIRPKEFQNDEYDAIFFDEFNRAPKKVRNAVMELIQFKSINGHKFNNLKVVWAAINPHDEDETYDVEKLDPAQIDRFHVRYKVPSVPNKNYFVNRYGPEMGKAAIEWWSGFNDATKKHVSARRLQYVMDCYRAGGDIKYLVHQSTNPSKLLMVLNSGSLVTRLRDILASKDEASLRAFLKKDNHFDVAVDLMQHDTAAIAGIVPFLDEERLMRLTHDIDGVRQFVTRDENVDTYADMLRAVVSSGTLDGREETRLRAILGRGVTTQSDGVVIFEPRPEMATETRDDAYDYIRGLMVSLTKADEVECARAYDYMCLNLQEPKSLSEVINALCVVFRFIDRNKYDMLVTRYTKVIPMINYLLINLERMGFDINDKDITVLFSQGSRKLNTTKVQGFIDTHHESFAKKPRIM